MTTAVKNKAPGAKRRVRKAHHPSLPPSAQVVDVGGRECVIVPLDEYEEWYDDHLLGLLMAERLADGHANVVPFSELEARLEKRKKAKGK